MSFYSLLSISVEAYLCTQKNIPKQHEEELSLIVTETVPMDVISPGNNFRPFHEATCTRSVTADLTVPQRLP